MSLIGSYEIDLSTPECHPLSPVYRANVSLEADISEVLPFVNAKVEKGEFIPGVPVLVWTEGMHKYALRPREIAVGNIADRDAAERIVRAIVDRVNSIWERRHEIEPSYESIERPKVLDILKLLPMTNCKECGAPTCMAFADMLAKDNKTLEECPALKDEECADKLTLLRDMGL